MMEQVFQEVKTNKEQSWTIMKFLTIIIASIIAASMAQNQEGGPQPDADAGVSNNVANWLWF